jgi:acyl-coenzyme A synthetase/AMP-(fatty) acid ligase
VNVVRDLLAARADTDRAVLAVSRDGVRETWAFGQVADAAGALAGAFAARGLGPGRTVLLLVGNRIEYVLSMLAAWWLGAAVLPCSEQLRPKDLVLRLERADPSLIVCDERNAAALGAAEPRCPVLTVPDDTLLRGPAAAFADVTSLDPAVVIFTSGTSGAPKLVRHGYRWVVGQRLQALEWMAAEPGELVWSTAAPGWSKSARNSFLAPWLAGASALLEDRRFSPEARLATIREFGVNVLCMAPTEYRLIAGHGPIGPLPSVRRAITAGEPLGAPAYAAWREQTNLVISDGYGQTETGQLTGARPGETAPPGSMGRALPGIELSIVDGELVADPATVPTFFLGYDADPAAAGPWRTGDLVRQDEDGWLHFTARADDVISAGYRIGPAEVEAVLAGHPAVRECAVIGVPDEARGHVVGAGVVLRTGVEASDELVQELQQHVRAETAPYKYPRRIWFLDALPRTTTGKINRRALRAPD